MFFHVSGFEDVLFFNRNLIDRWFLSFFFEGLIDKNLS